MLHSSTKLSDLFESAEPFCLSSAPPFCWLLCLPPCCSAPAAPWPPRCPPTRKTACLTASMSRWKPRTWARSLTNAVAKPMPPGMTEWVFVGPNAVLNDRRGKQLGQYYGPLILGFHGRLEDDRRAFGRGTKQPGQQRHQGNRRTPSR